ncbi:hypothetical protein ACKKBG_A22065 [Auxenochlorella protothecoides x Auxenochlorella symbiontica]
MALVVPRPPSAAIQALNAGASAEDEEDDVTCVPGGALGVLATLKTPAAPPNPGPSPWPTPQAAPRRLGAGVAAGRGALAPRAALPHLAPPPRALPGRKVLGMPRGLDPGRSRRRRPGLGAHLHPGHALRPHGPQHGAPRGRRALRIFHLQRTAAASRPAHCRRS